MKYQVVYGPQFESMEIEADIYEIPVGTLEDTESGVVGTIDPSAHIQFYKVKGAFQYGQPLDNVVVIEPPVFSIAHAAVLFIRVVE